MKLSTGKHLESSRDIRDRKEIRTALQKEWTGQALEEVAQAIHDEELLALLRALAELGHTRLELETRVAKLLDDFTHGGIDTNEIPMDSRLELALGAASVVTKKVSGRDSHGYGETRNVEVDELVCHRALTLTSLGGGRFIVNHDSLIDTEQSNPLRKYVIDNVIQCGTVIVLGRKMSDNGAEKLEYRIAKGVDLFYDDDTTTPHTIDTKLPVANVTINDISALKFGSVIGPNTAKP